jgi:hypothetical protein
LDEIERYVEGRKDNPNIWLLGEVKVDYCIHKILITGYHKFLFLSFDRQIVVIFSSTSCKYNAEG